MISGVNILTLGPQVWRKAVVCGDRICSALCLHMSTRTLPAQLWISNRHSPAGCGLREWSQPRGLVRTRPSPHPPDPNHGLNPPVTALASQQLLGTPRLKSMLMIRWWSSVYGIPLVRHTHIHRGSLRHAQPVYPGSIDRDGGV